MMSTYELPVINVCLYIKARNKVYNLMRTATFDIYSYLLCNVNFFYEKVIFFTTGCVLIIVGDKFRIRVLTIRMCLIIKWLFKYICDIYMMFINL